MAKGPKTAAARVLSTPGKTAGKGRSRGQTGPSDSQLSEEVVVDSDSSSSGSEGESDDESRVDGGTATPPTRVSQREDSRQVTNVSRKTMSVTVPQTSDLDDSASSTEPSSSSEEDDDDEDTTVTRRPGNQSIAQDLAAMVAVPASTPAPPFTPPSGFSAIPEASFSRASTAVLSPSTISGKQVWHIVAPSNVPLSQLRSISLDAIKLHVPLLTCNGTSYALQEDLTPATGGDTGKHLLLPSSNDKNYASVATVARTLHLRQHLELPDTHTLRSTPTAPLVQPTRSIRPQARGLKMRYRPPGFGHGPTGQVGVVDKSARHDDGDDGVSSSDDSESRSLADLREMQRAEQRRRFAVPNGTTVQARNPPPAAGRGSADGADRTVAPEGYKKKRKRALGASRGVASDAAPPVGPETVVSADRDGDEAMLDGYPAVEPKSAGKKGGRLRDDQGPRTTAVESRDGSGDTEGVDGMAAGQHAALTEEERRAKKARKAARAEKRAKVEAKRAAKEERRKSNV